MVLNPAMTGVFDGGVRLIGNYRNQWKSVTADYRTFMFSADANLRGFNNSSLIGLGVQVYSDVAGDLNYRNDMVAFSVSAMQAFDAEGSHILAGGFQFGNVTNRFDPSKIIAYDVDPIQLNGNSSNSYFDMAAGLLWYKQIKRKEFIYFGASLYHLNKPNVSFLDADGPTLHKRFVIHGGANVSMNKSITLIPNFIFMQQGPHQELTLGSFVRYQKPTKKKKNQAAFMLGGWLRTFTLEQGAGIDALITAIRVDYQDLTFTFTYDVNVSSLARVSQLQGGPEFSLVYTFDTGFGGIGNKKRNQAKRKKSGIKCPVF